MQQNTVLSYAGPSPDAGIVIERTDGGVRITLPGQSRGWSLLATLGNALGVCAAILALIARVDTFGFGDSIEDFLRPAISPLVVGVAFGFGAFASLRQFRQRRIRPTLVVEGNKIMFWEPSKIKPLSEFVIEPDINIRKRKIRSWLIVAFVGELEVVKSGRVFHRALTGKPWKLVSKVVDALDEGINRVRMTPPAPSSSV
jgi:hypothetical protein